MEDVDMDMVIDFDEPMPVDYPPVEVDLPEQVAPLPLNRGDAVPNKLHIRGLDDLTTENITSYSLEHFPIHTPIVEWIDGDDQRYHRQLILLLMII